MRPKQDCPAALQRALRTASGPRDTVINALPTNLLFVLAVAGMERPEKGPEITMGKLKMQRDKLIGRLEGLGLGEVSRAP